MMNLGSIGVPVLCKESATPVLRMPEGIRFTSADAFRHQSTMPAGF